MALSCLFSGCSASRMCQQRRKNHHRSTVSFHQAPPYLRTNPYIIKGYRANLSTLQCFRR
ncbi:hypothetical protein E2C01_065891 [Portunus trituberculatus]|uniref:Uncharacterized protein n=1 Tax=Portunus trituberculatus TaxID=210409 RepID=A0A5B7HQV8_PORTR|nr:hypothetical protein [Portunus trituberculatus]